MILRKHRSESDITNMMQPEELEPSEDSAMSQSPGSNNEHISPHNNTDLYDGYEPAVVHPRANPPALLLEYNYNLNMDQSKSISIGYDPCNNFRPLIVLKSMTGSGINFIPMKLCDLTALCNQKVIDVFNINHINQYFTKEAMEFKKPGIPTRLFKRVLLVTGNIQVVEYQQTKQSPLIMIKSYHSVPFFNDNMTIDREEMYNLLRLQTFLNNMWSHTKRLSSDIEDYFETYVIKCVEKNVTFLKEGDLFPPAEDDDALSSRFNYYRMFYEIPFISGGILADKLRFYYISAQFAANTIL